MKAKTDGTLEIADLRTITRTDKDGKTADIVVGRSAEIKLTDAKGNITMTGVIPYGSEIFIKRKKKVKKGDVICKWDPYNAVIISEAKGKLVFENVIEGVTYREEVDEQTGFY
jgi:DNA-directed RNA polymerase subunit beta'